MGYYVRAFCTSPKVPELAAIQRWLRERGSTAVLDEPTHAVEVARSAAPSTPIRMYPRQEWACSEQRTVLPRQRVSARREPRWNRLPRANAEMPPALGSLWRWRRH